MHRLKRCATPAPDHPWQHINPDTTVHHPPSTVYRPPSLSFQQAAQEVKREGGQKVKGDAQEQEERGAAQEVV